MEICKNATVFIPDIRTVGACLNIYPSLSNNCDIGCITESHLTIREMSDINFYVHNLLTCLKIAEHSIDQKNI